jgi:hypothetical protein
MRKFSKEGYTNLCKPRSKETKRRMSRSWTEKRKRINAKRMRENNPMHDEIIKAHYDKVMPAVRQDSERRRKQSVGQAASWTVSRRKALSKRMQSGSPLQSKMQENGNKKRIGKKNPGAQAWHDGLTKEGREARAENLSIKITERFMENGWKVRGFVKGKQGFLETRFGRLRYDSSWEEKMLLVLSKDKNVVSVERDYPVVYVLDDHRRRFLIDFRVEFKKGNPVLLEVKCPYFLDTRQTKAKVRAARRYASANGMRFVLVASLKQVEVWDE